MLSFPVTIGSLWSSTGQVSPGGLSLQFGGQIPEPQLSTSRCDACRQDPKTLQLKLAKATRTIALWNKAYYDSVFLMVHGMQLKLYLVSEFNRSQVYAILVACT